MINAFFVFAARYLYVAPVIVLGLYLLMRRWPEQKRMAVFGVPAALLAYLLGLLGNQLYIDPRPFVVGHFTPLIAHAPDNGFPSDHTLLVSAIAAVGTFWSIRLGLVLWVIALIVAVARVYVGLHHPIDVLGSIAMALVAVPAWYAVLAKLHPR